MMGVNHSSFCSTHWQSLAAACILAAGCRCCWILTVAVAHLIAICQLVVVCVAVDAAHKAFWEEPTLQFGETWQRHHWEHFSMGNAQMDFSAFRSAPPTSTTSYLARAAFLAYCQDVDDLHQWQ